MLVACLILCTRLICGCKACCIRGVLFHLDFVIYGKYQYGEFDVFTFCILRDGLFTAAAVSFGQHDFLCKDESKRMFPDRRLV